MPMHRPPPTTPLGLNLAPLVDVVMCLIIFFMLATKLVERENSAIDLPAASVAREAEKKELGRRVVVNVQAVREIPPLAPPLKGGETRAPLKGGETSGSAPGKAGTGRQAARYIIEQRTIELADVQRRLEAEHARDAEVRCVIRGDGALPYGEIEAVLAACAKAGITRVWFAAAREEQR